MRIQITTTLDEELVDHFKKKALAEKKYLNDYIEEGLRKLKEGEKEGDK